MIELTKLQGFESTDVANWLKSGLSSTEVEDILRNPALPPVSLSSERQELHQILSQQYPAFDQDLLAYVLSVQPQGAFLTQAQIEGTLAIIQRIDQPLPPGWEENNLAREIAAMQQMHIPGTDKLVYDLFNGNYTGTDYLGSHFQLTWVNEHLGQVASLEDFRPNSTKGVDVRLKDGTFIDTKSVQRLGLPSLQKQVDVYARDFPELQGHKLVFVLERSATTASPYSIRALEAGIQAYARQKGYQFTINVSLYP